MDDWTALHKLSYRTITAIIHPAVLGYLLVSFLEGFTKRSSLVSALGALVLVFSWLNYLVVTHNFVLPGGYRREGTLIPVPAGSAKHRYRLWFLLIDFMELVGTYFAFHTLWYRVADLQGPARASMFGWFFLIVCVLILLDVLWSLLYFTNEGETWKDNLMYVLAALPALAASSTATTVGLVGIPWSLAVFQVTMAVFVASTIGLAAYTLTE